MKHKTKHVISIHPDTPFIALFIIFFLALAAFLISYSGFLFSSDTNQQVACTEEARQCPDGSYVGRSGPHCEFTRCGDRLPNHPGITEVPFLAPSGATPSTKSKKAPREAVCTQEVKTCPDGSFVSKVGPECEFAPCPDDSDTIESGE